ncbi:MerR family transcriptional regulator [Brevibacterium litoralis]|uniref:MerR family transcriptional regulator n=1 Tax=Brevibacterium litoralis TaxID=3138935 RepID=UPI0032EF947B
MNDHTDHVPELSIRQVARRTGTTSRTLRHYDHIGLLRPTRIGANGYRMYGSTELVRLQQILLLRETGLGLDRIAQILDAHTDQSAALRSHLTWLHTERDRIDRRIAAVLRTVARIERGEDPVSTDMFDGFDNSRYEDEVTERWGAEAYRRSNDWWTGRSPEERARLGAESERLIADWIAAGSAGIDPSSAEAQHLAQRQADWLRQFPGTPAHDGTEAEHAEYVRALGDMYVADTRFTETYGGPESVTFVRDALRVWADRAAGERDEQVRETGG